MTRPTTGEVSLRVARLNHRPGRISVAIMRTLASLLLLIVSLSAALAEQPGDELPPEDDSNAGFDCQGTNPVSQIGSRIVRVVPAGPRRDDGTPAFAPGVCVYLPPGYDSGDQRYPVIYALHGGSGFQAVQFTDELDRAYLRDPANAVIVVGPDATGAGTWFDRFDNFNLNAQSAGDEGLGHGRTLTETYVLKWVIPYIDRHFRTLPTREGRVLFGISNGGYGAALYAAKAPDLFATAAIMSGNVAWQSFAAGSEQFLDPTTGAYSPAYRAGHLPINLVGNLDGVDLMFDIGTDCPLEGQIAPACTDPYWAFEQLFVPGNRELQAALQAAGHVGANDYRETAGGHDFQFWTPWFVERHFPFLLAHMADPQPLDAPVPTAPPPEKFRYRSIAGTFSVWRYEVSVQRDVREFLDLEVDGDRLAVAGSGQAVVTTRARYRSGATYLVSGHSDAADASPTVADAAGRLSIPFDLGPSSPIEYEGIGDSGFAHVEAPEALVVRRTATITPAHADEDDPAQSAFGGALPRGLLLPFALAGLARRVRSRRGEAQSCAKTAASVAVAAALLFGLSACRLGDSSEPVRAVDMPPASALAELPCWDVAALSESYSSFSRAGMNNDFFTVADPVPHQRPYLYRDEAGRYVLFDVSGPGLIKRLWMTQLSPDPSSVISQGPLIDHGRIQFFFDGESEPRVDLPAQEFFSGTVAPYLAPLCGDNVASSGGNYCYVGMPFAQRAVIAVTGRPNYWNIEYDRYAPDRPLASFDPQSAATVEALEQERALWAVAGRDPGLLPAGERREGVADLAPGARVQLYDRQGAGVVRGLEIQLTGAATLTDLWLEARWDGAQEPQVLAPLSDLFLSGRGEKNDALGLMAGFELATRRGYLYFPMPFRAGARVSVFNPSGTAASFNWQVVESGERTLAERQDCGVLHASYTAPRESVNGADFIVLDLAGATGKVVGLSYNVDGQVDGSGIESYLEGDERVYIDGSLTPQIYGTGTEDIFNGGFYYQRGPFTLPTHGLTIREPTARGSAVAQYRLLLLDAWTFRDSIRIGIEHGGGDGVPTTGSGLVYWYGRSGSGLLLTDTVDVGDAASEQAHDYSSGSLAPLPLTAYYSGDRDGNLSDLALDQWIFPGAIPFLKPDELVEDDGRYHTVGSEIGMRLAIDPANRGVLLRRRLDTILFDQRAQVTVDGQPAGLWDWPYVNDSKRWADHDFLIPAALTRGKTQIELSLEVLAPIATPVVSGLGADDLTTTQVSLPSVGILNQGGWSDFRYQAYALVGR